MQLKYPVEYTIMAKQIEDGKWELVYVERFRPEDFEAWRNAPEAFARLIPKARVALQEDRIIVILEDSRDQIMNVIAGEFLMVSSLGKTQLNELLAMVMSKVTEGKPE